MTIMLSQWECFLKNLGEWHGSFTRLSPQGELIEDTPTVIAFEALNDNKTVRQLVRRLPPGQPPQDKYLEYTYLNRSILFFENGAFCQGSMQWGPFSEFGAEFGLIAGDRRLRLVQLFDRESRLNSLTLIREKLAGSNTPERPPLTWEQLLGEWQGEATTIYPDFLQPPETYSTHLQIELEGDRHLRQKLTFDTGNSLRTISSTGAIEGSIIYFEQSDNPVQLLMLPDGGSSNTPLEIKPRQPFFLELGWLLSPNHRQRLIRSYGAKGEWLSVTLVREEKIKV